MTALAWTIAVFLGGVALGVLSDLLGEEVRGRLDRVPEALLRLAAQRVPEHGREDMHREWSGELHQYLHGDDAVPITRLLKGVRFAISTIRGAARTGAALLASTPESRGKAADVPVRPLASEASRIQSILAYLVTSPRDLPPQKYTLGTGYFKSDVPEFRHHQRPEDSRHRGE
ncbi:hypothetical protein [Nocardiopsis chromatogenes]|uniref:hypothetical protein n=1 Tax=Nocardiopsis chromatogenes TaxID=280239 RepID=UPI00034D4355|nr:hypothetical protein [Nocardiopsis chromatogenes]